MKLIVNKTARYISLAAYVQSSNVDTHSRLQEYIKLFPERAESFMNSLGTVLNEFAKDIDATTKSREG